MRIQNNLAAMNAQRNLGISDTSLTKSLEKLSSGYRINKAADDTAGLSISRSMRGEIAGAKQAASNVTQANSMLQVAEGGLDQVNSMLVRLRELATQAASANTTSTGRDSIGSEADQLVSEIDRIVNSTKYSGSSLIDGSFGTTSNTSTGWDDVANVYSLSLDSDAAAGVYNITAGTSAAGVLQMTMATNGMTQVKTLNDGDNSIDFTSFGVSFSTTEAFDADALFANGTGAGAMTIAASSTSATFQVGSANDSDNRLSVTIGDANAVQIGTSAHAGGVSQLGSTGDLRLNTAANAQTAISVLDEAINDISTIRGNIGAYQNRLSYASANLATMIENTQAAESVISDVDMAAEMTSFTKNQILMQAGTAMLAQANNVPQQILSLFR